VIENVHACAHYPLHTHAAPTVRGRQADKDGTSQINIWWVWALTG
jgi:hypothetical protein